MEAETEVNNSGKDVPRATIVMCHLLALCSRLGIQFQETGQGRRYGSDSSLCHHFLDDYDRHDGRVVVRMEIDGLSLSRRDAGHVFYNHYL